MQSNEAPHAFAILKVAYVAYHDWNVGELATVELTYIRLQCEAALHALLQENYSGACACYDRALDALGAEDEFDLEIAA